MTQFIILCFGCYIFLTIILMGIGLLFESGTLLDLSTFLWDCFQINLLVPCQIRLAVIVAPEEREGGQRVVAVGSLVGLDMAVQMGDVAHLVMADGGIAPTSVRTVGKAWRVAPEAVGKRIAAEIRR